MKKYIERLKKQLKRIEKSIETRQAIYEQATEQWKTKKGFDYQERTLDLIDIK